ncbi:MAG: hypothetical protein NZ602_10410, partial [Thermoguttaceae bacterium]|nr:hypothetical protein [Thermoguttaceae bacterium]
VLGEGKRKSYKRVPFELSRGSYAFLPARSETMILVAMIHLMVRRLRACPARCGNHLLKHALSFHNVVFLFLKYPFSPNDGFKAFTPFD